MKGIIYDCEIIRCIPGKDSNPMVDSQTTNYEYCKGWDDFDGMGISVICAMELESDRTYTFVHPQIADFQNLVSSEETGKICGFNSLSFDDNLCLANGIKVKTDFDLLAQVRLAAYGSESWQDCPKGFTYKLDAIARANGFAKTGSGSLAPQLWQKGKCQEVIDYCMNDVKITKELILLFLDRHLKDPNTGQILSPI
ncbi:MAG: hypothetical protein WCD53_16435 [Microcoleus sp.]